LFGVGSSVFVSLNGIYTKEALPWVEKNDWRLSFYTNVNATLLFIPIVLVTETEVLVEFRARFLSSSFWLMMVMTGVLGFLINIVSVAQINVTSPLTHNISGTAKACVQTALALIIWRNPTTASALMGVTLVIGGSLAYAYVRHRENQAKAKTGGATSSSSGSSSGDGGKPTYVPLSTIESRQGSSSSAGLLSGSATSPDRVPLRAGPADTPGSVVSFSSPSSSSSARTALDLTAVLTDEPAGLPKQPANSTPSGPPTTSA